VFVGAGFGYEWFRSRVFVLRWSMFVCWMSVCGIVFCDLWFVICVCVCVCSCFWLVSVLLGWGYGFCWRVL